MFLFGKSQSNVRNMFRGTRFVMSFVYTSLLYVRSIMTHKTCTIGVHPFALFVYFSTQRGAGLVVCKYTVRHSSTFIWELKNIFEYVFLLALMTDCVINQPTTEGVRFAGSQFDWSKQDNNDCQLLDGIIIYVIDRIVVEWREIDNYHNISLHVIRKNFYSSTKLICKQTGAFRVENVYLSLRRSRCQTNCGRLLCVCTVVGGWNL